MTTRLTITDEGKVQIEDSCGCIFCDIGAKPELFEGKAAHRHGSALMLCTKDGDQSSKRSH